MIDARGVSRGTRIRGRRSLRATAAARVIRLSAIPAASFATVVPLHGTITIASNGYEPEAGGADRSSFGNTRVASFARSFAPRSSSSRITSSASRLTMRSISPSSVSRSRCAYAAPEAPVTPTTVRIADGGRRFSIDNDTEIGARPGEPSYICTLYEAESHQRTP